MWIFIISGAVYLIGVAVVLVLKPSFMFTPDGNWKEFGIGQNPERCTTFPFWLFCITWALVSYTLVLLIAPFVLDDDDSYSEDMGNRSNKRNNRNNRNNRRKNIIENDSDLVFDDEIEGDTQTLPKGYYVLNKKASRLAGAPKYVFIGEE